MEPEAFSDDSEVAETGALIGAGVDIGVRVEAAEDDVGSGLGLERVPGAITCCKLSSWDGWQARE